MPTPIIPKRTRSPADTWRADVPNGSAWSRTFFIARAAPTAPALDCRNSRRERTFIDPPSDLPRRAGEPRLDHTYGLRAMPTSNDVPAASPSTDAFRIASGDATVSETGIIVAGGCVRSRERQFRKSRPPVRFDAREGTVFV